MPLLIIRLRKLSINGLIPSNLTWDLPRGRKLLTEECKSLIPSSQNYLSDSELSQLNLITTAFLDMAESRAARHIVSTMDDWKKFLQQYLATMDYEPCDTAGKVTQEEARDKAYSEYENIN